MPSISLFSSIGLTPSTEWTPRDRIHLADQVALVSGVAFLIIFTLSSSLYLQLGVYSIFFVARFCRHKIQIKLIKSEQKRFIERKKTLLERINSVIKQKNIIYSAMTICAEQCENSANLLQQRIDIHQGEINRFKADQNNGKTSPTLSPIDHVSTPENLSLGLPPLPSENKTLTPPKMKYLEEDLLRERGLANTEILFIAVLILGSYPFQVGFTLGYLLVSLFKHLKPSSDTQKLEVDNLESNTKEWEEWCATCIPILETKLKAGNQLENKAQEILKKLQQITTNQGTE